MDRIAIIGNTQMPFWHQPAVAKALRLPLNRVRMVSTPIGGAFGQKNDITIEPNLAVLAMKLGRPVKWAMTTEEDFCFTSTKIPVYLTFKVGVKSDGTLVAVDRKGISNTGAYASTTMITMNKCTLIGAGPYLVPNHRAETLVVYTNKCRSAAFRAGGPPSRAAVTNVSTGSAPTATGIGVRMSGRAESPITLRASVVPTNLASRVT